MDTKSFKFFIFFVLIIFFVALVYLGIGVFHTISANSVVLEDHFSDLTGKILTLAKSNSPLSATFTNQIEKELSADPYISCITLSDSESVFYAWPADSTHLIMNELTGNPEILADTPSLKTFSVTLQLNNSNGITVTAALNTILKSEFYTVCSRAFIIVLAGTIFDFLLLLYVSLFSSKSKTMDQTLEDIEDEINTIAGKKNVSTVQKQVKEEPAVEDVTEKSALDAQDANNAQNKAQEAAKSVEISSKKERKAQKKLNEKIEKNEKIVKSKEEPESTSEDPAGLFSEKTGFGWESYLEPRLDAELIRAASNEMDLTLFVINIKELDKDSSVSKDICESLLNFFKYKDMVFEYGESGFAGIFINMDIESAMAASEVLYSEIISAFEKNGCHLNFGIGLTTRSLRLITGSRLLNEATKASEKALEEKTLPIVAYRVNHEKSKQYLAEETERYVS